MKWPTGGRRQTPAQRKEIIELYLVDPEAATALAISRGLADNYAYRVAYESGLLPLKNETRLLGKTHVGALVG